MAEVRLQEVIGRVESGTETEVERCTTPRMGEVELRLKQQSRKPEPSAAVFIQGTACLFQTQAKYLRPCRQGTKLPRPAHAPCLRPVGNDAHGCPLQRRAPTVGALGDAAMDENDV